MTGADPSEHFGWVWEGSGGLIFDRTPHFVGYDAKVFSMQDKVVGALENTAWYHLAMILNTGYRTSCRVIFPLP